MTTASNATDASGVPVQCVPGLSGGTSDQSAARRRHELAGKDGLTSPPSVIRLLVAALRVTTSGT